MTKFIFFTHLLLRGGYQFLIQFSDRKNIFFLLLLDGIFYLLKKLGGMTLINKLYSDVE